MCTQDTTNRQVASDSAPSDQALRNRREALAVMGIAPGLGIAALCGSGTANPGSRNHLAPLGLLQFSNGSGTFAQSLFHDTSTDQIRSIGTVVFPSFSQTLEQFIEQDIVLHVAAQSIGVPGTTLVDFGSLGQAVLDVAADPLDNRRLIGTLTVPGRDELVSFVYFDLSSFASQAPDVAITGTVAIVLGLGAVICLGLFAISALSENCAQQGLTANVSLSFLHGCEVECR